MTYIYIDMFVCPVITQEPHDRLTLNFDKELGIEPVECSYLGLQFLDLDEFAFLCKNI